MVELINLQSEIQAHSDRIWSISWHPTQSNLIATSSSDRSVKVFTANQENNDKSDSWYCKYLLDKVHKRTIRSISFSKDGSLLACASFDATTSVWEYEPMEDRYGCVATIEGHENEVKSVAWSYNSNLLATCSRDKSIWIWDCKENDFDCSGVLQEHNQDVKMVVWHPTEELLASASYDDTIKLWRETEENDDWTNVATLQGHTATVWAIDFNKDGSHLVSVSADGLIKIWERGQIRSDYEVWTCKQTIQDNFDLPIYTVSWAKYQKFDKILVGSGDNSIRVYHLPNESSDNEYKRLAKLDNPHGIYEVNTVAWSPTIPNLFASGADDGTLKLWRLNQP